MKSPSVAFVLAASLLVGCVVDLPDRELDQTVARDAAGEGPLPADLHSEGPSPDQAKKDGPAADLDDPCGNGTVDPGEHCDTAIMGSLPGGCPVVCPKTDPCVLNNVKNPGTCQAHCAQRLVTACLDNDGCCPKACKGQDQDCPSLWECGNGKVDPKESCDGNCPSSCAPRECKNGQLIGAVAECTARCLYIPAAQGAPCGGGRCHRGACCKGCWTGAKCLITETDAQCGKEGEFCQDCAKSGLCCVQGACAPCTP